MTRAADVAKYILEKVGPVTAMKLQKLVYYSQAWSLVWDERPLFSDEIQAWRNGPVVPELYAQHRGMFKVTASDVSGDSGHLDELARETVDIVLDYYNGHSAQYLSDLTHLEDPWIKARKGCDAGENSEAVISHASMAEYYQGLEPDSSSAQGQK